ncbi:MAG: zinc-dependent peptidase, family [Geobacteraceae bacterium]|nr:zinc-dependent peptidase, family [Geobacteraceae bacterium]
MKRIFAIFLLMLVAIAGTAGAAASPDPRSMAFPPLKFQVPETERIVLKNGMIVYLLEDRELPLVSITAYIGAGSVYEPSSKTGLAGLTGTVIRSGGTAETSPEQLDDELEFMASSVESSIGTDAGIASMNCLKRNLDGTLRLFSQVLMHPAFRSDRVELARKRLLESLRRENDNPKELADRELIKAIYRGSPLGMHPSPESVSLITREDLVEFHRKFYHPGNIIMGVAGDFTRQEMVEKLNRAFGAWKKEPVSFSQVKIPETKKKPELYLVKKETSQSVIRMGHLGIDKNNPDIYALRVMNFILGGGGFESKLMSEIRTRQGLAYNVDSDYSIGRRFPGTFTAETETKAESTAKTIGLMQSIIRGMTERPVSEGEITQAKESIINSFIFGFTSSASVAGQKAMLEYYGYPREYLDNFRKNISRVTKDDVLRVAKKYLRPEAMTLVVVGDEKKFDKPLSNFGEVSEIRLNETK